MELHARRGEDERPGGGPRGAISAFSDASRRRLLRTVAAVPWQEILGGMNAALVFVTLTYHEVPGDGRRVKRDLRCFGERWRRRHGALLGAWKLEFQRRGAAHFHLALIVRGDTDLGELRRWVAESWNAVAAPGDALHARVGTGVEWTYGNLAGYFAKYAASADKEYQHQVPEAFEGVGRWWGLWGVAPEWETHEVTRSAWCSMRRSLRSSLRRKVRRPGRRADARIQGLWVMSREERGWAAFLAAYALGVAPLGRPPW